MTRTLSMVSCKNHNVNADEGFVKTLTSKLITCFLDGFTLTMKPQSIAQFTQWNGTCILDFGPWEWSALNIQVLWVSGLQECKSNEFSRNRSGGRAGVFGRVQNFLNGRTAPARSWHSGARLWHPEKFLGCGTSSVHWEDFVIHILFAHLRIASSVASPHTPPTLPFMCLTCCSSSHSPIALCIRHLIPIPRISLRCISQRLWARMAAMAAARAEFLGQSLSAATSASVSNAIRPAAGQVVALFGKKKAAAVAAPVKKAAKAVQKTAAKGAAKVNRPDNEELAKWYGECRCPSGLGWVRSWCEISETMWILPILASVGVLALFCVVGEFTSFTMDKGIVCGSVAWREPILSRSWPSGVASSRVNWAMVGDDVKAWRRCEFRLACDFLYFGALLSCWCVASFTMDEALHIVVVLHKRIYPSSSWPSASG